MHLRPDELVDLAEGQGAESSVRHAAACEACRRQVEDLASLMSAAADVEVPEPSPLFWDHFSARVRDRVVADGLPRRGFWGFPRVVMPVTAAVFAGVILAVAMNSGRLGPPVPAPLPPASSTTAEDLLSDLQSAGDDGALALVADLSSGLDLDSAREAGLANGGSAEHAVTHLNAGELQELRRLLQEELARSGA